MSAAPVPTLVDHLFRHASRRVVAGLTLRFGPRHLQLAEDAVQEALIKALRFWPYRGVPENPEAWLRRVAQNAMIDALRRDGRLREVDALGGAASPDERTGDPDGGLLAMMLMCCDAALAPDAQVALTLKLVAGFGVPEIARAFLAKEATIAQKLSRVRRAIRERYTTAGPLEQLVGARVDAVMATLYLLFNEGYALSSGDAHISRELCDEAIRLTELLAGRVAATRPEVDALLALMLLQAARMPARIDADGSILTLEEQDRTRWDARMIERGVAALNRSARGDRLTSYHLQAGIASYHSLAPDYAATDWQAILDHYDALIELSDSPLVRLNRCVAVAMAVSPRAGLREVERLRQSGQLDGYALLHATAGELAWRCGEPAGALASFERALRLVATEPERRLIERKLRRCRTEASSKLHSPA